MEDASRSRTVGGFGGGEDRGAGVDTILADGGGIAPAGHCRRVTAGGAPGLPIFVGRGPPLELLCTSLAAELVDG